MRVGFRPADSPVRVRAARGRSWRGAPVAALGDVEGWRGRAGRLMRTAGGPATAKSMLRFWENGMFLRQAVSGWAGVALGAGRGRRQPAIAAHLQRLGDFMSPAALWRPSGCAVSPGSWHREPPPASGGPLSAAQHVRSHDERGSRGRSLVSPGPPPLVRRVRSGRPDLASSRRRPQAWPARFHHNGGAPGVKWPAGRLGSPQRPAARAACWCDREAARPGQVSAGSH